MSADVNLNPMEFFILVRIISTQCFFESRFSLCIVNIKDIQLGDFLHKTYIMKGIV